MNVHFLTTPPVGTILMLDAQRYELIGVEPYLRKDGGESRLLTWQAHCPDCGKPFEIKTGLKSKDLSRRCVDHRAGLRPVGKRGDRVVIRVIEPEGVEAA